MPQPESRDRRGGRVRVFIACSGLGVVRRGYETFMRNAFESLRKEPGLDVYLFKGAGDNRAGERALRTLHRDGLPARILGAVLRRGAYVIEQVSFTLSLIPHVVREKPDVIFFCDPAIGKLLSRCRRVLGGSYRLLLHNSGPHAPPFPEFDLVQQVTPSAMAEALEAGESPGRHILVPAALNVGASPQPLTNDERRALRQRLGLPSIGAIVLSVGALNRNHKRMDYLIREVAALPEPRPHLVLLGQQEDDTPAVRAIATLLLGESGVTIRTVDPASVDDYYRCADVFVLASLREGFGFVYGEAMAHGLPCIAHDFAVARFVLGEEGVYADLRQPGALAEALQQTLADGSPDRSVRRHDTIFARFSWPMLAPRYVAMFHACARGQSPAPAAE